MIPWQDIYSIPLKNLTNPDGALAISDLSMLKLFLDMAHKRYCLVKPYQELKNYPLVEARELLPSFENDMFEYKELPGFSMVAFGRQLDYFSEIFQYDKLHPIHVSSGACPLEHQTFEQNIEILNSRLPKRFQENLRRDFKNADATLLENYTRLLPYLLCMDRAQVFGLDVDSLFHLAGVFASFPSDIDSELKRFGMRIGKFVYGDNSLYERNRMFVYQYFMELYGFPIVSERRTSSALFARKLHRLGENFLLRVLGQSDRTLTTYFSEANTNRHFPRVEKIALVAIDEDQKAALDYIDEKGFFLDQKKRVVIMRVTYRQHKYDSGNFRQDRALSIAMQEILHPLTGESLKNINVVKDLNNMLLRLNDIVRGEYIGCIAYKRNEIVENTDTDEKRLKFLYSWLCKHQRRMIGYSDDFFNNVSKVVSSYIFDPQRREIFDTMRDLYQEVCRMLSYIQQARKARVLNDISVRYYRGNRITYSVMLKEALALLKDLQYEIVNFFPELVETIINCVENMLHDRYLRKNYIEPPTTELSSRGLEIRKNYGRIVAILDDVKAVRKSRLSSENRQNSEAGAA